MSETAISVSLHEGTASKIFTADVLNPRGHPLQGVEVIFELGGEGSLAADVPISWIGGRTDGLGRASVSFNRLPGEEGRLGGRLTAHCSAEAGQIRLYLLAITPECKAKV